jgi:spore coat polysaccharide biosynthesis predicted glycosyltransferase SpsG
MRDADLAVGAAGTSAWERCCMGLPSVTIVLAGNQRGVAAALGETGASAIISDPSEAGATVERLVGDPERLAAMSAAASGVTDGAGASRIADELIRVCADAAAVRA